MLRICLSLPNTEYRIIPFAKKSRLVFRLLRLDVSLLPQPAALLPLPHTLARLSSVFVLYYVLLLQLTRTP